MAKSFYLISNIGTYDCSVEVFTDWDEAMEWYRDFITSDIQCVLAQECDLDTPQELDNEA